MAGKEGRGREGRGGGYALQLTVGSICKCDMYDRQTDRQALFLDVSFEEGRKEGTELSADLDWRDR